MGVKGGKPWSRSKQNIQNRSKCVIMPVCHVEIVKVEQVLAQELRGVICFNQKPQSPFRV